MATLARTYNRFLVTRVAKNARGCRHLVDFGAGTGTFARELRQRGFQVTCVEPDDALRRHLGEQGLDCVDSLDALPKAGLDFVFSLNVLEHIEDDCQILNKLYHRLRPGGTLYLYVPAFNVLFSSMDRKVGHYRRYTKGMLLPRLERSGFVVHRARYVDSLGFFASLWFRWFGNDRGDLNPLGLRLYDRYVFPVSRLIDIAVGGLVGKNLEVTAVRTGVS